MSITDELRRYISGPAKSGISHICEKAIANIADRIDAEHESACGEAYGNGVQSVALPDMTAYVKLPLDADGVPIRVGDVMDKGKVTCIRDCGKGWEVIINNLYTYDAPSLRHHAPTVEDVLREFAEKVIDSQIPSVHPTYEEAINEYAQRLQLREVDE